MKPREIYSDRPTDHGFTFRYAQPNEYHFCLDSIIFPYFVARQIPKECPGPGFRVLDLCAGCGVVGFELANHRPWIEQLDFLEIQPIFRSYFEENLRVTRSESKTYRWLESDFRILAHTDASDKYDLVVANPPYFRRGEGVPPMGAIREQARYFGDASWNELLASVVNALKPGGRAYLLARPGEDHGRDDEAEFAREMPPHCTWRIAAEIRGTWAIEIAKLPQNSARVKE